MGCRPRRRSIRHVLIKYIAAPARQTWLGYSASSFKYADSVVDAAAKSLRAGLKRSATESLMQGLSLRDPVVLGAMAAALCSGTLAYYLLTRKRPSAEEIERARRLNLVKTGRIIDGTVIDIAELDPAESGQIGGSELILYRYEIAGVIYECAQDVTALRNFVDIHDCRLDFPCSVRYEPHRPGNSIVVAENWTGLRESASPFPMRRPAKNPAAATVPRR